MSLELEYNFFHKCLNTRLSGYCVTKEPLAATCSDCVVIEEVRKHREGHFETDGPLMYPTLQKYNGQHIGQNSSSLEDDYVEECNSLVGCVYQRLR